MTMRKANTPLYSFLPGVARSWIDPDATLTTTEPQLLSCQAQSQSQGSAMEERQEVLMYRFVHAVRAAEVALVRHEERDRRDPGEHVGRERERAKDRGNEGVDGRVGEECKDDDVEARGPGDCARAEGGQMKGPSLARLARAREWEEGKETYPSACACRTCQSSNRGRG